MITKVKILVADDDENLRELITDTIENAEYEIISASDGREALEKAYSESPDIMVLDINMPHLTGYEVCEKIRKDILKRNLPIIMLTVRDSEKDEIKGLRYGVDDYITKPFRAPVLLARIRSALQRVRQGISVNPLTYLSGNAAIIKELENRLRKNKMFTALFLDLDNFKAYNDYYGFKKGDEVIKETARIIVSVVTNHDKENGFVGHIGGDDFVAVIKENLTETVCNEIIKNFDSRIIKYYSKNDQSKGFIVTENRKGEKEKFPIMTISIGAATSRIKEFHHVGEISRIGNELKKYAKKYDRSNYVVDRRVN